MSWLSLIGSGKRQPAPAPPTTSTATTDTVSIHGHLSSPSRRGSIESLAPAAHSMRRSHRTRTDSTSYSSQPSTNPSPKPSAGWHKGVPRVLPSSLRSSPSASRTSLVESQDDEFDARSSSSLSKSRSGSRSKQYIFPRKASTSLEQEWMEVEQDSSDEDDFGNARQPELPPTEPPKPNNNEPSSSKPLNESVVMVEDERNKARLLAEELSATKDKLAEITNQCSALQQQVESLVKERQEQAARFEIVKKAADAESAKITRTHTAEMEAKRREVHQLRQTLESLQRIAKDKEEKLEMLVRENEVLHEEVVTLEKRSRGEEEEVELMRREVEAANTALRSFKERSKASIEAEREEKKKLKDQVDELWRQLGDLQQQSKKRDEQIQQLRSSEESTGNALRNVQTLVDEKDKMLEDLQQRNAALAKQREQLQEQLAELETEVTETKNSAQRFLAKTKEDHQNELAIANGRIQGLEEQVSAYATVTQQLRSSVKASRADVENAKNLVEERAAEIKHLNEQLTVLEETLRTKEQELADSAASRASVSHLDNTIRSLRQQMEKMEAEHALELYKAKFDVASATDAAKRQVSQLEKELTTTREKLRDMRNKYDASEQSRRMLRDQLSRRDEEGRGSGSNNGFGLNSLSSSIIRDPSGPPPTDQAYTLLQNLNYEIFQTAALLADSLCMIPRPASGTNDLNTSELIDDETTSLLGPYLLSLVRAQSSTPLDSYDPFPLQTAIQATLVCCATRVMSAWYPTHWDHSDFLVATYTRIREAEGIAASETWKAMTRARLRPTTTTVARVVDFLNECLSTIFRYAGWPAAPVGTPGSGSSSSARDKTIESLLRDNREKLASLARHSLRLNVILDSVNPQLEPALVEPGSVFDRHVMDCEDGDARRRWDEDDEVVSTSEIGLRKVAEEGRSSSSRRRVVLKPKVILRSSFDA